jgi:hypothetical protein
MGGGANSSESSSRPLTAGERFGNFAGALAALSPSAVRPEFDSSGNVLNQEDVVNTGRFGFNDIARYSTPDYEKAQIVDPGNVERFAGGNYDRLEQSILKSRTAPLERALSLAEAGTDADAAKRGIWSSGLAIQSKQALADKFAPELRAAAADAATQRYGAEQADVNAANQYNQGRASTLNQAGQFGSAQKNSFEMENANRRYNAQWAPANYLSGVYNGTGGAFSNASGGGWNFSI